LEKNPVLALVSLSCSENTFHFIDEEEEQKGDGLSQRLFICTRRNGSFSKYFKKTLTTTTKIISLYISIDSHFDQIQFSFGKPNFTGKRLELFRGQLTISLYHMAVSISSQDNKGNHQLLDD